MDTRIDSAALPSSFPYCISPQALGLRLGRADAPLLLDVRRQSTFTESSRLIASARHCAPGDIPAFAARQRVLAPLREIVAYCVHGHGVSADAVTALRAAGLNATRLAGGMSGGEEGIDTPQEIALWRAHRLPTMLKRADWGVTGGQPSRWITRSRPKIDRIACPWLIRRFIDPLAEFFYAPAAQVLADAARLGAVAFDLPGAPVSHVGELCSFDALLSAFELQDAALDQLARVVRGADTDCLALAPESAGLLALSLGLSQLHADDHAMLEAALPLYDALYAWCRSAASAASQGRPAETHSWQPEGATGAVK